MQKITPTTNRRLHALLTQAKLTELKPMLVAQFSCIQAASSKDLLEPEALALCKHIEKEMASAKPVAEPLPSHLNPDRADVMRKKIFSLCLSMGYIYGFSDTDKAINKAIVYKLVESRGYLKKPLMKYSQAELVQLVSQFEGMQRNNNKAKAGREVKELLKELDIKTAC